jgi:predicted RNA-binding protein with PIN domain
LNGDAIRDASDDGSTALADWQAGLGRRLNKMRWLVDGMNVIGTRPDGWWRDRHAAMVRLVDRLERWSSGNGEDVIVVFEKPPSPPISSTVIEVAHAPRPRPNSADDEIARRLAADPDPANVRVVTSDRWLADKAHAAGAVVEPADAFRSQIEAN